MKQKIAVLITCHNRRNKTINCLQSLYNCILTNDYKLEVFLVDDGSTDGTTDEVRLKFREVNIIKGNGNLFWNKGMLLAWHVAYAYDDFDFYLWLNDDTFLENLAINELLSAFSEIKETYSRPAIIVGACKKSLELEEFSYGGKTDLGAIIPNGYIQECKYINGNVVLVQKEIFKTIGFLSSDFTHTLGDYDYGLRTIQAGYKCYSTKKYIAICEPHQGYPDWCNPKTPYFKRLKLMRSPKGLNITEYNLFNKKYHKKKWILLTIKAYLRVTFPLIYNNLLKQILC